jgi:hypothetical protein
LISWSFSMVLPEPGQVRTGGTEALSPTREVVSLRRPFANRMKFCLSFAMALGREGGRGEGRERREEGGEGGREGQCQ